MYHIKVYHMHKILQVTFNTCKNVSGDKPPPQKKTHKCICETAVQNDFYCNMYAKQTFRLSHCSQHY